jgi:hypothetical protein
MCDRNRDAFGRRGPSGRRCDARRNGQRRRSASACIDDVPLDAVGSRRSRGVAENVHGKGAVPCSGRRSVSAEVPVCAIGHRISANVIGRRRASTICCRWVRIGIGDELLHLPLRKALRRGVRVGRRAVVEQSFAEAADGDHDKGRDEDRDDRLDEREPLLTGHTRARSHRRRPCAPHSQRW